ncbi:MAG: hypothetical protein AB1349_13755, partial [Elusimicrobiota bacterium]
MGTQENEKLNYLKSDRIITNDVLTGKIEFDEFALLEWLKLMANPHSGSLLTNYSDIAQNVRKKPNWVKYNMDKLKDKQYIWFELSQGQRTFSEVLIGNFPLSGGTRLNISKYFSEVTVNTEKKNTDISEVDNKIQKLIDDYRPTTDKCVTEEVSEVQNIDKEKENESDSEKKN